MVDLPLPVGPGDQKNSVRQRRVILHAVEHVLVEAEAFQIVEIAGRAVQQTHHDAFAVKRGQRGNAEVDFAAQRFDLDAAVLRQAALGDIQLRHQLHARNDGGFHLARRRILTDQHAVDAIADAKIFFERLNVNIAGALFDRQADHGVDHANDGRFAGHVAQMFQIFGIAAGRDQFGFGFFGLTVEAIDRVQNFLLPGDARANGEPGAGRHGGTRFEIQRIGHRQRDRMIVKRHWQALELAQEPGRERFGFGRNRGRAIEREQRNLQLLGQR